MSGARAEAKQAWKEAVRALSVAEDAFDAAKERAERAYGHGNAETQRESQVAYAELERALERERVARAEYESHR